MRRFFVVTGAVAAGAFAWSRVRGRRPGIPKPVTGMFPNGMAYARLGTGSKTLLWILGGPGIGVPKGLRLALLPFWYRPYVEKGYSVWIVARKQGMPKGHTFADMAEDYAGLIADEFDGKVDLVIGEDNGGAVGFCLAARHPERVGHIAIAAAGYEVSEQGKTLDYEFARLRSEGRSDEAFALLLSALYPDIPIPGATRVLGALMARLLFADANPHIASDVMVEAEAERAFDAREILPRISVPVLLICGDGDLFVPKEVYEETARLIPDCTLRIYEGKGLIGATSDKRFPGDVLDFVARHARITPEEGASEPVISVLDRVLMTSASRHRW